MLCEVTSALRLELKRHGSFPDWKLSQSQIVSCPGLLLAERIAHPSSIIPSGLNIYTEGERHHLSKTHSFASGETTCWVKFEGSAVFIRGTSLLFADICSEKLFF
ncbi:hypothetical protein AMECASPLE_009428 [Ameca splendens]|uniref:Uncharacterized protein n=1 Tax=Ameca splendens TaxID=208324 RepID=A0ABV0Y039_9TELE